VRLAGGGALAALDLTYVVPAARWWPLYTLQLSDEGRRATWLFEALVAQATGEDWRGAKLSVSTADLIVDARLPELASLRLGRAQAAERRAYRAPPAGLDRMFESYDRVFGGSVRPSEVTVQPVHIQEPPFEPEQRPTLEAPPVVGGMIDGAPSFALAESAAMIAPASLAMPSVHPPLMKKSRGLGRSRASSSASFGAPAPPAAPMMALPVAAPAPQAMARAGGAIVAPGAVAAAAPGPPSTPVAALAIEPAESWLDFDALRLAPPADRPRRGRLYRLEEDHSTRSARSQAVERIEHYAPPQPVHDPRASRGTFDHRFDAEGLPEVPSDGLGHRIMLGAAEGAPTLRWRTVPREAPEVYREVELKNTFDAPLLKGPVDVYVDGSLLVTTPIDYIDKGGILHVGMGVEERIRVARNARVEEDSAGLLGGSIAVKHAISIELNSSLGAAATVEVVDRLPVTDDKTIEVKLVASEPASQPYAQEERGQPVRGGLLWKVPIAAGGKRSVEYQYRVTLPAKSELVGGNRRE
jgi:hypothetical protein